MNDRWMRSFLLIAEKGSISQAADALYISPVALLQQLNLMEESLGFKLFVRSRKGVSLTPAGEEFRKGAAQLDTIYSATLQCCQRLAAAQSIRIPVKNDVVIPTLIEAIDTRYAQRYPASDRPLRLLSTSTLSTTWTAALLRKEYDIIQYYTTLEGRQAGVYYEPLGRVPTWCLMRKEHPLAAQEAILPEDLAPYRVVALGGEELLAPLCWYMERTGCTLHT